MKKYTFFDGVLHLALLVSLLLTFNYGKSFLNVQSLFVNGKTAIFVGKVIFIDAGHGGNDDGAKGDNVLEDEINLHIAKILYEKVMQYGSVAYMSRIGDYDLSSIYAKNHKKEDMKRRAQHINTVSPDVFISIHLNHYPNPSVQGAQVFYREGNGKAKTLADFLQQSLNTLNRKKKISKTGDYYLTNNSIYPGVIIECGFLSNYEDRRNLVNIPYQEKLVDVILDGLGLYFEQDKSLTLL